VLNLTQIFFHKFSNSVRLNCFLFLPVPEIDTYINLFHLSGQADYNTAVRISLITKKLYSIQSRFWHENVEKSSLYHISTI